MNTRRGDVRPAQSQCIQGISLKHMCRDHIVSIETAHILSCCYLTACQSKRVCLLVLLLNSSAVIQLKQKKLKKLLIEIYKIQYEY